MIRLALSSFVVAVALLGCGQPPTSAAPAGPAPSSAPAQTPTPAQTADSAPPLDAGPDVGAPGAPDASAAPAVSAAPTPPAPPAPVERTGKTWPFHAWDRAEAVTFNQFPMRRRVRLYAYNEHGWSEHIVDRKPLDAAGAKKAVNLVTQTNGGVDVSKCPFPRHAVVLYDHDVPVASINVCFACGDILLWPPWETRPDWSNMTDKQLKELELRSERQMKLYDKVFPKWEVFFRDEVGFSIDARYH